MARPLRISYCGAVYHVMARGNNRQMIFLDDDDYREFSRLLGVAVRRFRLVCHITCLMPNHYHFVLETPAGNLSKAIHWLNCLYARWWNDRHQRCGHVFQGRFKAQLVQRDRYLHALRDYIHLNPVRSGIVSDPADWRWSSYRAYAGLEQPPEFLHQDLIYGLIGANDAVDPGAAFRTDLASRKALNQMARCVRRDDRWIGDSPTFDAQRRTAARRAAARQATRGLSRRELLLSAPPLSDLIDPTRSKLIRNTQMRRAHREYGYRLVDIARYLDLDPSTVKRAIRAVESGDRANGQLIDEADVRWP